MDNKKRVLIFSHTPFSESMQDINGASLRNKTMLDAFKECGYDVDYVSIGRHDSHTFKIHSERHGLIGYAHYKDDITLSQALLIRDILKNVSKDDVVVIDQPFSWLIIREFIGDARVIYSSHNHESDVARQIARVFSFQTEFLDASKLVTLMEEDLLNRSDAVIAVSKADAKEFKTKTASVPFVIPNRLPELLDYRPPVLNSTWNFTSSNWPLNWYGLIQLVDPIVIRDAEISLKIIGGAGEGIMNDFRGKKWLADLGSNVQILGKLTPSELHESMRSASGSINPVLMGGGTNFKLIEAARYGHKLITTSFGARGDIQINNLNTATTRKMFNQFLENHLNLLPSSVSEVERVGIYDWKEVISNL
jgi:hypothetical protein